LRRRLFDPVIRGHNQQVNVAMGEESMRAKSCRWCRLVQSGDHIVYDEPAFVVLEGPSRRRGRYVTLVTKAHTNVITELPPAEMGAVLAGLTRASERLREASGAPGVQVRAHPTAGRGGRGHLHFRLMPELPAAQRAAYEAFDSPSAFASLAETISH
jgi:diadenosine tetraphosphate (Ap4A) HIT family hydrolase